MAKRHYVYVCRHCGCEITQREWWQNAMCWLCWRTQQDRLAAKGAE